MKIEMNRLKNIQSKLHKVELSYTIASNYVANDRLKQILNDLANNKKKCLETLLIDNENRTEEVKINYPDFSGRKRRNEYALVRCLHEEESLIKAYQKSLTVEKLKLKEVAIVKKQLVEALVAFNQLRAIKQSNTFH